MKNKKSFYIIFIATIILIRLLVFIFPNNKLQLSGTVIHHFWIGLLLIFVAFVFLSKYARVRVSFFAVGLGLFCDELVYMLAGDGPVSNYWSVYSVSGMILCCVIIFILKKEISGRI